MTKPIKKVQKKISIKEKKTLIITVGLPRSGKSTWAREQNCPIVSPDSIRKALYGQRFIFEAEEIVWATAKLMVKSLFGAGHSKVILDSTMMKVKYRRVWISSEWTLKIKHFKTTEQECIKRAKELEDETIIPIIQRMAKEFEPLDEFVN